MRLTELAAEYIFVFEEIGYTKPDLKAFRCVEQSMGLDRTSMYMVGDSYPNEMAGAINAGWKSIWFTHRGSVLEAGNPVPDYQVSQIFSHLSVS